MAGYIITWLVPWQVGFSAYSSFAIFRSLLFFIVSALSGIQQEVTRATRPRVDPIRRARHQVVAFGAAIAHIIQLDRVAADRFRILLVVLLPVFAILVIDHVDRFRPRTGWFVGLAGGRMAVALTPCRGRGQRKARGLVLAHMKSWQCSSSRGCNP